MGNRWTYSTYSGLAINDKTEVVWMTSMFGYSTSVGDTEAIEAKGVQVLNRLVDVDSLLNVIKSKTPDVDYVVLNDGLPDEVYVSIRAYLTTKKMGLKLVSEL